MSGRHARRASIVALFGLFGACEPYHEVALEPPEAARTETPAPSQTAAVSPTPEPRCDPAVLESEPSERFDLVAIIEVQPRRALPGGGSALEAAKLQACMLGGDALVILYRNERQSGSPPVITGPSGLLPSPELRAAVIRYRR